MANKKAVKKLPMKLIKEDYDKYTEKVEIDFEEDGNTYRVTLHPFFEEVRINKAIQNFSEDMKKINNHGKLNFPDELIAYYVLYHTILEFSDFPSPNTKDIAKKVSYFTQVINTKYFKEVTRFLIQSEVERVWDKLIQVMQESERLERMVKKVQEEIQNLDLQSPELKERLQIKKIPEA